MVKDIFNAVGQFLYDLYPEWDIYKEYPKRDFEPPAFVLTTTGGNMVRRLSDETIDRGLDYQNFIINIFNFDIIELAEATRQIKMRLRRVHLENGDVIKVVRKNSSVNATEGHATVSFTVLVSETIEYGKKPAMERLNFKESVNG